MFLLSMRNTYRDGISLMVFHFVVRITIVTITVLITSNPHLLLQTLIPPTDKHLYKNVYRTCKLLTKYIKQKIKIRGITCTKNKLYITNNIPDTVNLHHIIHTINKFFANYVKLTQPSET